MAIATILADPLLSITLLGYQHLNNKTKLSAHQDFEIEK